MFWSDNPTRIRFFAVVSGFFRSEYRWKAIGLSALLIGLLLATSGLNVVNSYVNRDFMSAIALRNTGQYATLAAIYLGVFAASTVVAVFARFTEERLGLVWREWLTGHLMDAYLKGRAYYRLHAGHDIDNPDQRIAEDVKAFTLNTLSFVIMILNGTITTLAFSSVLWSISPQLFLGAMTYAAVGSLATIGLGRRLVGLNYAQSAKEANFRFDLVHVREHVEPIALQRAEPLTSARLRSRLSELIVNACKIVVVNRNLGFFTSGYNYLIQIIPILIVAPLYLRGRVEFGVVTQSTMAFAQVVGAFSLIITQFQQISTFAAVIARLSSIAGAIERTREPAPPLIAFVDDPDRIAFEGLTLRSAHVPLILDLTAAIPAGGSLLVLGPDEVVKGGLVRAVVGLWDDGDGRIARPPLDQIMVLPQRPYMVPGTLRDQFPPGTPDDEALRDAIALSGFGPALARVGGLDVERNWSSSLSPGEQHMLAFARLFLVRPRFALLDRVEGPLGPAAADNLFRALAATGIGYLTAADHPDLAPHHDAVLDLADDGTWTLRPAEEVAEA